MVSLTKRGFRCTESSQPALSGTIDQLCILSMIDYSMVEKLTLISSLQVSLVAIIHFVFSF